MYRIFLLSPAYAGGKRARMLLRDQATFPLAMKLRTDGARLSEVFTFLSGLYFRGKTAYADRFAAAPDGVAGSFVITPNRGLVPSETIVRFSDLQEMAAVPVDASELRYRTPLEREARIIESAVGASCVFVLLGSIATSKYVEPLLQVLGTRLLFPADFVGSGDMSRGGLLLRCARDGVELDYVAVMSAVRHGPRPPKLPRLTRERPVSGGNAFAARINERFDAE